VDIDLLDAVAIAIHAANPWMFQANDLIGKDAIEGEFDYVEEEKDIPAVEWEGNAP
jgi:hypothetical protein